MPSPDGGVNHCVCSVWWPEGAPVTIFVVSERLREPQGVEITMVVVFGCLMGLESLWW